jgi:hypothetical protein
LFRHWQKTEYTEIRARIRNEKAEIHWCDYADIPNAYCERNPIGKGQRDESYPIKMISTVTNRGKFRFMLLRQPMTSEDFYTFLVNLSKDCTRHIFLILYNNIAHHSRKIYWFLDSSSLKSPQIEMIYLPSDLPEHNPTGDELDEIARLIPSRIHVTQKAKNSSSLKMKRPPTKLRKKR